MYIYKLNVCELLYTENQKFLYTDYMLLKASRNTKNGFIWILRGVFYIDVLQNLKKKKKRPQYRYIWISSSSSLHRKEKCISREQLCDIF